MTVISDTMQSLGYAPDAGPLQFYARVLRTSADSTAIITPKWVHVGVNLSTGVFTTPDLDPGPAVVRIDGVAHDITIPDIAGPIQLWPLLQEAMSPPDGADTTGFVVDGGGFRRVQVMSAAAYVALKSSTTPDPGSTFFIYT